jgi:hypothetical protein
VPTDRDHGAPVRDRSSAPKSGKAAKSKARVQLKRDVSNLSFKEQRSTLRPPPPTVKGAVQTKDGDGGGGGDAHSIASKGVRGGGGALPHQAKIQQSFGAHDVSGVKAHTGGAAKEANAQLSSTAYATGNDVAFRESSPSVHTAAHEAAHVVQQRGGVQLKSGIGQPGDRYEKHADAVADAVVQGKSAEPILNQMATPASGGGGGGVQGKGPIQAKDVVQFEPFTFVVAGITLTVAEALTAVGMIASAAGAASSYAMASKATSNRAGPDKRVPSQGALFAVGESGKDIMAAMLRVMTFKELKRIGETAANAAGGSNAEKQTAGRAAMDAQKDNVKDNCTTKMKNRMQRALTTRSDDFVWNDQNARSASPTYGKIRIETKGGSLWPHELGVLPSDYAAANVERPEGSGAEYFQTIRMSATCDDSTVEWWDKLEVMPGYLEIKDAMGGKLKGVGEATFGWEDSITKMKWEEGNPIDPVVGPYPPKREGTPND